MQLRWLYSTGGIIMKYWLDHMEELLGAIFLALMATISFINVITRYFFHFSIAFTEELTLYMFVWATLLGVSSAFKHGSNMCVSLLYERFPKSVRKYLYIFIMLVSMLFFVALMYYGYLEVCDEMLMGVTTEATGLPVWYFTVSMPLISILTMVRILVRLYSDLKTDNY